MKYLITIILCLTPFGHFLLNKCDIWHSQGFIFQIGVLILLCYSFFEKPKRQVVNKPLGVLFAYMGLTTAIICYITLATTRRYAVLIYQPLFNFLTFVIFYKVTTEYLTPKDINNILKWMSLSVGLVLIYCVVQIFNLDPFYRPLSSPIGTKQDFLVGTIGNSTHLAGYLAMCQPLFFKKGWYNYLALALIWIIIFMTSSASGLIVGLSILIFWLYMNKQYKYIGLLSLLLVVPFIIYRNHIAEFFSFNHRLEYWGILMQRWTLNPIFGSGLGILNAWKINPQTTIWRHAHLEYLQVMVELGIVGLGLVIWGIIDYYKRFIKSDLRIVSIFTGFLILCLFNFPCHLWLLASIGMVGYSFPYALEV